MAFTIAASTFVILLHGWPYDIIGAPHPDPATYANKFSGKYSNRVIKGGIGHNLPQEAPKAFADAIIAVDGYSK